MENSQVQNDLRYQFFAVLMMLGIFFVSDAFCHDDGTTHTHAWNEGIGAALDAIVEHAHIHGWNECPPSDAPAPAPPPGDPPTDDNPLPPPPTPNGLYKPPPVEYKHNPSKPLPNFIGRDIKFDYPGCSFASGPLPPDERNQVEQTPGSGQTPADERNQAEQPRQQTPGAGQTQQPQTPADERNQAEQTQQQTPGAGQTQQPQLGTNPTLSPLNVAQPSTNPKNVGSEDSNDANPVSTPTYTPRQQAVSETYVKPMLPVKVTEYMLRDWIKNAGGGFPQWIEVYNPNTEPVNLKGYQFTYAHRRFANRPWTYKTQSIPNFIIPAQGAVIIASKPVNTRHNVIAGIPNEQVWVIPNGNRFIQLKNGWHLADPNGKMVHRIGHAFREYPSTDPSDWDSTLERPHLPTHTEDGYRVSYQWPASVAPAEAHFYGNATDVGSPGFYEPAVPKAPSLVTRKKISTWAALKSK